MENTSPACRVRNLGLTKTFGRLEERDANRSLCSQELARRHQIRWFLPVAVLTTKTKLITCNLAETEGAISNEKPMVSQPHTLTFNFFVLHVDIPMATSGVWGVGYKGKAPGSKTAHIGDILIVYNTMQCNGESKGSAV